MLGVRIIARAQSSAGFVSDAVLEHRRVRRDKRLSVLLSETTADQPAGDVDLSGGKRGSGRITRATSADRGPQSFPRRRATLSPSYGEPPSGSYGETLRTCSPEGFLVPGPRRLVYPNVYPGTFLIELPRWLFLSNYMILLRDIR